MRYPETRADSSVVDELHGSVVADPYRWLEDQESGEVADWVARQQAVTEAHLSSIHARAAIRERLAQRWDYPKAGVPWRRGPHWFQLRNSGLQEQSVLWTMASAEEEGRVLLDPAELSADGTVSLADVSVSADGRMVAYGTSDGGSDWTTWRVRDTSTGVDLPDRVPWAKFSSAAWLPDGSGFFYGAYDPPVPGSEMAAANTNHKLRFHRLGADAADDPVVYARPDEPLWGFSPSVTEDGAWLVVTVWQGTEPRNRVYLARLGDRLADVEIVPWLDDFDADWNVIGNDGDTMFVRTDLDAPGGRLLAIDAGDATVRREVIPESPEPLVALRHIGGRFVAVRMRDAVHRMVVHDLDGVERFEVPLDDLASVGGITGHHDDPEAHLSLSSFTQSAGIVRLSVADGSLREIRPPGFRVDGCVTEQVMVASTGDVEVPLFLVRAADAPRDGTLPVMLYGYGGFGIPLTPEFRLWWTAWLDAGGAVAVGCFRGGSEYGREWHDAGRLANKPNTFDDAIACARWLVTSGWSSPQRIAITGGSNGGLTAAAAMIREPGAFGACVPEVGVLDLLRFHKFTIGWGWTSDYGDPDDAEAFELIKTMSPLHTLVEGTCYPPTLVTTADRDDRVVPAHSFKFIAALQAAQGCDNPVLARIDTRAGHGAGTSTSKMIDARADVLAFLQHHLMAEGDR